MAVFLLVTVVVVLHVFSDRLPKPARFNSASGWVQVDSFILEQQYGLLDENSGFVLRSDLWEGDLDQLANLIHTTGNDTQLVWTAQQLRDAGLVYDDHTVTGIDDDEPRPTLQFIIAPNPHSDLFAVDVAKDGVMIVYDVHGSEVYRTHLKSGVNVIDLDRPSGVYFARYQGEVIKIVRTK